MSELFELIDSAMDDGYTIQIRKIMEESTQTHLKQVVVEKNGDAMRSFILEAGFGVELLLISAITDGIASIEEGNANIRVEEKDDYL